MPKFKVTADRPLGCARQSPGFNPFLIRNIFDSKTLPPMRYHVREWEFEATDEVEVRRLWDEAQAEGIENVKGYTLKTIEQVPNNQEEPHASDRQEV